MLGLFFASSLQSCRRLGHRPISGLRFEMLLRWLLQGMLVMGLMIVRHFHPPLVILHLANMRVLAWSWLSAASIDSVHSRSQGLVLQLVRMPVV